VADHVKNHDTDNLNTDEQKPASSEQVKEAHTPVMIGILHGLAGSAPALALIPAMMQTSLSHAMGYLMLFSVAVLCSMVAFGLSLGLVQKKLQQKSVRVFNWSRKAIAFAAVGIGFYWLSLAL
jgi:sulfite exporter TauE/SafE